MNLKANQMKIIIIFNNDDSSSIIHSRGLWGFVALRLLSWINDNLKIYNFLLHEIYFSTSCDMPELKSTQNNIIAFGGERKIKHLKF